MPPRELPLPLRPTKQTPPSAPPAGGTESLADRWRRWRDRVIASPGFQHRAAAFWPTRFIARRRARALFDLVAGFVYSQVLAACVRLDLFAVLAEGPQDTAALARRFGLAPDAATRLLRAAASLQLVERRGTRWGLGPLGAPMVGNAAVAAMVEHHAALYADLRDPVALLRGEAGPRALAAYWPYADERGERAEPAQVAAYSALMSASQPLVAEAILDAYPLGRHTRLLDVGGGEGRFVEAVARRWPALQLALFDLPAVAERARVRLGSRAQVHGGDFLREPLPQGADVISLVRVVHDHADEVAAALLAAVHAALPPGGTLLLAEPMAETPGAEAMGDAYFGFYLLAMGRGRPRTAAELETLLRAAGFARVQRRPTHVPLQTGVLVALKARQG